MSPSIFKKNYGKTEKIDIKEAFSLWNLLRTRYREIEGYKMLRNFVHDRDFDLLLVKQIKNFENQVSILESEGKKFKVKFPMRPPLEIKTSINLDEITDRHIYRRIFEDLIADLYTLTHSVKTATTNDRLRNIFEDFLITHLNDFEQLYKFGKLKGWNDVAPAYKMTGPVEREHISISEANHIWEHLVQRYDQIQLTQIFLLLAHDVDFRALLDKGMSTLTKQVKILEKEAINNEVPLPERPPASQEATIDPEAFEDMFIYRIILTGIQDAVDFHIRAVIETLRNDYLRKVFFKFLKEELKIFNEFLSYGKMKGWTKQPPIYMIQS